MIRRTLLALACLLPFSAVAQDRFITLASTTSTEQSGLFGHIIPLFRQQTGINVRVVAVDEAGKEVARAESKARREHAGVAVRVGRDEVGRVPCDAVSLDRVEQGPLRDVERQRGHGVTRASAARPCGRGS